MGAASVLWRLGLAAVVLVCAAAVAVAVQDTHWIVIGADASVYEVDISAEDYKSIGRFSWNDSSNGARLVLTGPMRGFDATNQIAYVAVNAALPYSCSRIIAVTLLKTNDSSSSGWDLNGVSARESPVLDFVVVGLHYDEENGTLLAVVQSGDEIQVVELDTATFATMRTISTSPAYVYALGASAFDSVSHLLSIQVLDGFFKYVATVDVTTGVQLQPQRLPYHFFGFEYSNISRGILAASGAEYVPVDLSLLDPESGEISDQHVVFSEGSLVQSAVGFDPVSGLFGFTVFNGESTYEVAELVLIQTSAPPFHLYKSFHVPADSTVCFPRVVCI